MEKTAGNDNVKLLTVYERMLGIVWQRLAPTFGQRTIAAIARNVIALKAQQHPLLQHVEVDDNGFQWATFKRAATHLKQDDIVPALDDLLDELFAALSDLIGRLIVEKVVKEVRQSGPPEAFE